MTTSDKPIFTMIHYVEMARLVYIRFDRNPTAATAAWRRLTTQLKGTTKW